MNVDLTPEDIELLIYLLEHKKYYPKNRLYMPYNRAAKLYSLFFDKLDQLQPCTVYPTVKLKQP